MELGTSSGISNISSLEDLGMEQSLQRIPNIPENRAGEYSSELPAVVCRVSAVRSALQGSFRNGIGRILSSQQ